MQEYRVGCKCGHELLLTVEADYFCQIRCVHCQQILFSQQQGSGTVVLAPAGQTAAETVANGLAEPTMVTADACQRTAMSETSDSRVAPAVIADKSDAIVPGVVAGKFELVSLLGQGGMGKVFLARSQDTQERVVVKFLKIDTVPGAQQAKFVDYFLREMQVLKELSHPHIVQFKGCGNLAGYPYLAMEFVDGHSLEQEIRTNGPMALSLALPIVFHVASALEYGENRFQLIHRDIKPANIMLLRNDKSLPKLIDFGLAKTQDHYYSLTVSGATMGTLFYMPPEQIGDAKHADARADIYALAATFYCMLAGRPPFSEMAGNSLILRAKQQKQPTTPLSKLRHDVPARVCEIIDTAMAFDVGKRYPTITQFKHAIKEYIVSQGKRE